MVQEWSHICTCSFSSKYHPCICDISGATFSLQNCSLSCNGDMFILAKIIFVFVFKSILPRKPWTGQNNVMIRLLSSFFSSSLCCSRECEHLPGGWCFKCWVRVRRNVKILLVGGASSAELGLEVVGQIHLHRIGWLKKWRLDGPLFAPYSWRQFYNFCCSIPISNLLGTSPSTLLLTWQHVFSEKDSMPCPGGFLNLWPHSIPTPRVINLLWLLPATSQDLTVMSPGFYSSTWSLL